MWEHYILIDSSMPPSSQRVFYVGRTERTVVWRLEIHVRDAKRGDKAPVCDWIRSLLAQGSSPAIRGLGSGGESREQELIDKYRQLGSPLLNKRKGGW